MSTPGLIKESVTTLHTCIVCVEALTLYGIPVTSVQAHGDPSRDTFGVLGTGLASVSTSTLSLAGWTKLSKDRFLG